MAAPRYQLVDVEAWAPPHRLYLEGVVPEMPTGLPAILFVGGAFDGSWLLRNPMDYWALRGYPSWAVNLRGYYRSAWPAVARLTVDDYLDDIRAAVRHLQLTDFVLAGYSIGGILAQKYAERWGGVRALVLYDSDWPRAVADRVGEQVDRSQPIPPMMNFWPPPSVVEEMLARPAGDEEYRDWLALFKRSFLSGQVWRALELDRLEVDAARVTCPVLVIGIAREEREQAALAELYGATHYIFEGHSHGSILISKHHLPLSRRVADWLAGGCPRGERKIWSLTGLQDEAGDRTTMKLHYYSGWEKPAVCVCNRRGQELDVIPMRRTAKGRYEHESRWLAEFELLPSDRFYLRCQKQEDRPFARGYYQPSGSEFWLMDGELFPWTPPALRQPQSYLTREIYSPVFEEYFKINVMLPRDYRDGERGPYPVAVLNDGQNQWKNQGANGGWHTDVIAVDRARRGRCRDVVLVSIPAPWRQRNSAYHPPPLGQADQYADFVADTVLPTLRKELKLSKHPGEIAIIGASYGANCAVYCGLKRPDVFGMVGSLSYAPLTGSPIRNALRPMKKMPFAKLYADCGTRWALDQPHRDDNTNVTRDLIEIAATRGMLPEVNLLGIVAEGHFHTETDWRKRIGRCLEFLFPNP